MHEIHLLNDLINKLESIARENNAKLITKIELRFGALTHISPEHFKYHFANMTKDKELFDKTQIDIEIIEEIDDYAFDILIKNVTLEYN